TGERKRQGGPPSVEEPFSERGVADPSPANVGPVNAHHQRMSDFTVEVITTTERLSELAGIWKRLTSEAEIEHPFLTYDWIRTWWDCFGAGAELRILLVRAGGEPIAIAPLMRTTE